MAKSPHQFTSKDSMSKDDKVLTGGNPVPDGAHKGDWASGMDLEKIVDGKRSDPMKGRTGGYVSVVGKSGKKV